jgi:hypothetical protein
MRSLHRTVDVFLRRVDHRDPQSSHTRANMTAEYDDRALNRPSSRGALFADDFF